MYTPIIDINKQTNKVIFIEIDTMLKKDKDFSWSGSYFDIANYLYGTQYDDYFFAHASAKQKGKIFSAYSSKNPMAFIVWFELEKKEIDELINKNKEEGTGQRIIHYYFDNFTNAQQIKILSG